MKTKEKQGYSTEYKKAPRDRLKKDAVTEANKQGLGHKDSEEYDSYRTPVLQAAYNLGRLGKDLSGAEIVSGIRYGKSPDSGISYNYASDRSENGLSLAQERGGKEIGSAMWFADRKAYEYRGVKVGIGSDGETIILPLHVENLDE